MATHRIPILGPSTLPDTSGECWMEYYPALATNDVWKMLVGRFGANNAAQPTVRHGMYGSFIVPKNYVGTPKVYFFWTATLTSGNVVWDFEYRAIGGDDAESLDQAGTQESLTVTDAAPTAAHRLLTPSVTLTAANLAADDLVEFFLARDGADAADTMAGSALLFAAIFEYADA